MEQEEIRDEMLLQVYLNRYKAMEPILGKFIERIDLRGTPDSEVLAVVVFAQDRSVSTVQSMSLIEQLPSPYLPPQRRFEISRADVDSLRTPDDA